MSRGAVLACVGVVAAFAVGTRFGGERVEVRREPGTTRVVTETRAVAAPPSLTAEQIRAIVREELPGAREEVVDEPEPPARAASAARAHEVVERGIDHGRWTEQDRDDLRAAMQELDRGQADEVMRAVIPALNDGRVELSYVGTPL